MTPKKRPGKTQNKLKNLFGNGSNWERGPAGSVVSGIDYLINGKKWHKTVVTKRKRGKIKPRKK